MVVRLWLRGGGKECWEGCEEVCGVTVHGEGCAGGGEGPSVVEVVGFKGSEGGGGVDCLACVTAKFMLEGLAELAGEWEVGEAEVCGSSAGEGWVGEGGKIDVAGVEVGGGECGGVGEGELVGDSEDGVVVGVIGGVGGDWLGGSNYMEVDGCRGG